MKTKQISPDDNKLIYLAIILVSTFLQGSSFVATKLLLHAMPPMWLAGIRFMIAALALIPILLFIHRDPQKLWSCPPQIWLKIMLLGMLQTAAVMIFLTTGLQTASPSAAAVIMSSNPILVAVLSAVFLQERLSAVALFGCLLSFAGVIICIGIIGSGIHHDILGECLIVVASTSWALATLFNKKFNLPVDTWIVSFWQMLMGSMVIMLAALVSHEPFTLPQSSVHWLALFWLSIPASTIAMGLWFLGLKMGGATQTSGFLFLCPLFSTIIAYFVLGTHLALRELIGGVLICMGLCILMFRKTQ